MMDKIKLNYFIDLGMFLSFLNCFFTGLLKWPGLTKLMNISISRLSLGISTLHDWSGLTLGLFALLHLLLHWNWIVCVTKSMLKGKKGEKC